MWLLNNTRGAVSVLFILVSMVSFSSSAKNTRTNVRAGKQATTQAPIPCICVPYYYCNSENIVITNGQGLIDIRQASTSTTLNPDLEPMCEDYLEVCCRLPKPTDNSPKCGLRHVTRLQQHIPRLNKEEAELGEFPWIVTIFRTKTVQRNNETERIKVYQCQGTLISERVVLTAAQCIAHRNGSGNSSGPLFIRAGQLDTMTTSDEVMYQERDVKQEIIHKKYNPTKLQNNVALLVLHMPIIINRFVDVTCLAHRSEPFDEDKCVVVGWDKYLSPEDARTQRSQANILKSRSEPHVKTTDCNAYLRNTPLGKRFKLDNSSVCAGGPSGKNFCSNEIGSPLFCPLSCQPERYVQVGVASWCIRSGNLQTPSIFASVVRVRGWIDNQMQKLGLDSSVYRATTE